MLKVTLTDEGKNLLSSYLSYCRGLQDAYVAHGMEPIPLPTEDDVLHDIAESAAEGLGFWEDVFDVANDPNGARMDVTFCVVLDEGLDYEVSLEPGTITLSPEAMQAVLEAHRTAARVRSQPDPQPRDLNEMDDMMYVAFDAMWADLAKMPETGNDGDDAQ